MDTVAAHCHASWRRSGVSSVAPAFRRHPSCRSLPVCSRLRVQRARRCRSRSWALHRPDARRPGLLTAVRRCGRLRWGPTALLQQSSPLALRVVPQGLWVWRARRGRRPERVPVPCRVGRTARVLVGWPGVFLPPRRPAVAPGRVVADGRSERISREAGEATSLRPEPEPEWEPGWEPGWERVAESAPVPGSVPEPGSVLEREPGQARTRVLPGGPVLSPPARWRDWPECPGSPLPPSPVSWVPRPVHHLPGLPGLRPAARSAPAGSFPAA